MPQFRYHHRHSHHHPLASLLPAVMNTRLPWREAKYIGSYNAVPHTPWQTYLHLYWKVGRRLVACGSGVLGSGVFGEHHATSDAPPPSAHQPANLLSPQPPPAAPPPAAQANLLFFGAVTFVTPMRFTIPLQVVSLAVTLVFTAQRCRLECGLPSDTLAWPLTAASWPETCATAAAAAGNLAGGTAGMCMAAARPGLAERYYSTAASWIAGLLPVPAAARHLRARASCLALCISVHGWLQAVGGVLVPLAVLWALEERLRCREVSTQRRQWREAQGLEGWPGGTSEPCRPPRPLTAAALLAWLACSAWLLWVGLEALLL